MLLLNLAKIRTAHERFDREYPPETFADDRETFTVATPVKLGVDIYRDKENVRLAGRVQTTLELLCSRCLEPFTVPVDATFDLRYRPRAEAAVESEREVQEDDFATAFYDNDEIDLGELMREQFYLAVPMKPLCDDGCRGLCPQCGINLNKETCACATAWEDPRFAALKALREPSRKDH
jgi:uncharacterized protein